MVLAFTAAGLLVYARLLKELGVSEDVIDVTAMALGQAEGML